MSSRFILPGVFAVVLLAVVNADAAEISEKWSAGYSGEDSRGAHVLGYWTFDDAKDLSGKSAHGHALTYSGAVFHAEGKRGGSIESFPGYPVSKEKHAVVVKHNEALSPRGAFTMEMWIRPKGGPEPASRGYLLDKKYVGDRDYQWIIGAEKGAGERWLEVYLGFETGSERFVSEAARYEADRWHHIAFSYDGAGTVSFFKDGALIGRETKPGRGAVASGTLDLSIGDRRGSNYGGFDGYLDEVRICEGAREFRPLVVDVVSERSTFLRMEEGAAVRLRIRNLTGGALEGAAAEVLAGGKILSSVKLGALEAGAEKMVEVALDTKLRPGRYEISIRSSLPGDDGWEGVERTEYRIVSRKLPRRMPVVMWGLNSNPGIMKELPRLKEFGFTHCLGARTNYGKIYEAGEVTLPDDEDGVAETRRMLDAVLAEDFHIITNPSAGRWARDLKEFQRVDRKGKPYARHDVNGLYPEMQKFCENVGASLAQAYGEYPAFAGALIHTEVRGHSQLSFSELDRNAYREATGREIPEEVRIKNGVEWGKIKNFPADRVIADDDPVYQYYKWFWKDGDGWNGLHSAVHRGLKSTRRPDFWTFHDPAVRTTSVYGSGGAVDFISQWTYSYPDPIRIGLATDELFAMAKGAKHEQGVMKMTQVIWYRSQTAPVRAESEEGAKILASPWEDRDPGADYITIAPMHLREAFWVKMSRPIQGIMYHGWQSLVETHPPGGYRYTHPETQHELKRLVEEVVEPLGPMLLQVPDRKADVAFLESFASQMYARRGTYGWNHSWAGDAYHILQYAHVQPEIVFDETVMERGLDGFKVLAMFDCDVLTRGVVDRVLAFQKKGGIVIGDERLAPAVVADIVIESMKRTKKAELDKAALLEKAEKLSAALEGKYRSYATASTPDVVTRSRRYLSTDYVFAVNDRREFGTYVGQHGMVMENGLPVSGEEVVVRRSGGVVYELPAGRRVEAKVEKGVMRIPVELGPAEGRVFVILEKPIEALTVKVAKEIGRGGRAICEIGSAAGAKAVLPVRVEVRDPDGRLAEFSGYYGMVDGKLELGLDFASNDTVGLWEIRVEELLGHAVSRAYVRVK